MIPPSDSHRLRYDPGEGPLPVYDGRGTPRPLEPWTRGCVFEGLVGLLFVLVVFGCLSLVFMAALLLVASLVP